MEQVCKFCGKTVELVQDESGLTYCPECGVYQEEEEILTE